MFFDDTVSFQVFWSCQLKEKVSTQRRDFQDNKREKMLSNLPSSFWRSKLKVYFRNFIFSTDVADANSHATLMKERE